MNRLLRTLLALPLLAAPALAAGCSAAVAGAGRGDELRLGYFANLTHVTALVGVRESHFARHLGPTRLRTQVFSAGPAAVEALFAGGIDAAYLGPNPAANAYVRSRGEALRIVAGAASGGAALVVRPGLRTAADLRGRVLATPQLGGTQDVALRAWLAAHDLRTRLNGGGDVTIAPSDNATTLQAFRDRRIDGAWVPEPWASRLVLEAGGTVLVDERSLWPGGRFATTQLVVSTRYLRAHPDVVRRLLRGHVAANAWIVADPTRAAAAANAELERLTTRPLSKPVLARAFATIEVTNDPLVATIGTVAAHAVAAGLMARADLRGIHDLRLLDEVLAAEGLAPVGATDRGGS